MLFGIGAGYFRYNSAKRKNRMGM